MAESDKNSRLSSSFPPVTFPGNEVLSTRVEDRALLSKKKKKEERQRWETRSSRVLLLFYLFVEDKRRDDRSSFPTKRPRKFLALRGDVTIRTSRTGSIVKPLSLPVFERFPVTHRRSPSHLRDDPVCPSPQPGLSIDNSPDRLNFEAIARECNRLYGLRARSVFNEIRLSRTILSLEGRCKIVAGT